VMLDATRALENAWFIQQREPGYSDHSVKEILLEICANSDGATVSSKKDNLVNIGVSSRAGPGAGAQSARPSGGL